MTDNLTLFAKKRTYYLFLFLITIVYSFVYFTATSPFIELHEIDSSWFIAMGKMFLDGLVPYVDFFDQKGPVIILIQAIGQLIAPYRTGAFILGIINMFVVLILVDRLLRMFFKNEKITLSIILLLLVFLTTVLTGANYTEELSLIPMIISLHIGCQYFFIDQKITRAQAFVLGICLSFFVWLRITNGPILYAFAIYIFIASIRSKDFETLKNLIVYSLIGFLPLTLAILLYFYCHDAVYDLMYGTFLFNIKYATNPPAKFIHGCMWINILALILIAMGSYRYYKEKGDKQIFLLSALVYVISYFAINTAYLYKHYFITYMPTLLYGFILIFRGADREKAVKKVFLVTVILSLVVLAIGIRSIIRKTRRVNPEVAEYKLSALEMMNRIEVKDVSKAYYYNVNPRFYTVLRINTNYKYFTFQEWMGLNDPNVLVEINDMMVSSDRPLWVLMEKSEIEARGLNDKFKSTLERDYSLKGENEYFLLYRLN